MADKKSDTKLKKESSEKTTEETTKKLNKKHKEKQVDKLDEKPVKEMTIKEHRKKTKQILLSCMIVALIAVVIGVIVTFLSLNQIDSADPRASLTYSNAFFIYDGGKYKLFNAEGKRVVEDDFDNQSNFVDGYAMVKKGDQYGIIREDGAMTVELGKFGNITAKGGLYFAQDGNTKEYFLITGTGKELAKGNDLEIYSPSSYGGFVAIKTDGKIKIFSFNGGLIKEFDVDDKAGEPILSSQNDYGLVHYGDKNILLDARNGQVLAEFDGSRYTFDSVSDSRKVVLLESYSEDGKYKLYINGKTYDLDEAKNYALSEQDTVIGYDNYSEVSLLDKDYKVVRKVSTYLNLKDSDNYAVENEDGNAEIYQNGEKIKDFGDDSSIAASGVLYDDFYGIEKDGKCMFYKLDGSVGINHEFKDIYSLFDKFHHAVVADEEKDYYLIDTSGNKLSEETFRSITSRDGGYEAKNSEGKYAILNQKGEKMTDNKYDSVYYRSKAEPRNIWTGRSGYNEYDIIDIEHNKVLLEKVNIDSFYANYFTVKNKDGKIDYYTYDGTLFYTSEQIKMLPEIPPLQGGFFVL